MMIYICKFSIYLKDSFLGCRYNITPAYLIKFYIPLPPLFKFNPKPIYPKFKITKLNFSTSFIKIPKMNFIPTNKYIFILFLSVYIHIVVDYMCTLQCIGVVVGIQMNHIVFVIVSYYYSIL